MYLYVLGVLVLAAVLGIGSGCQPGEPVPVPDLVGHTQVDAVLALDAAGLVLGTVTEQYSENVAEGLVISQMPAFGNFLVPGEAVDLVLSKGLHPMVVPDVVGQTQLSATLAIIHAHLIVGEVTRQYDATVPSGSVVSQNPAAGASLEAGMGVDLVLSRGPQPVTVPNVVGMTQAAADSAIVAAGLVAGAVTNQYSATIPAGEVIDQTPAAGAIVPGGTVVALVVSKGPQPVTVPNVVGMTQAAAGTAITGAGLTAGAVTQQYSGTVPSGSVISQTPVAGASALPGTAVDLVVSKGPQPVTVPDVVGMTQSAAGTAIVGAALYVGEVTQQYSATVPSGQVVSQTPAAGTVVLPGTMVDLVVSKGPQPVTVPGVVGVTQAAASTAIINAGLTVGAVTQQYSATVPAGNVISQAPLAGASALPGTAVALVVSRGPQPVTVPNVVGMTQAAAGTALTGAGLAVGAVTQQYSATVTSGNVISQAPLAGASALPGAAVALVVSMGPQPVTVPNVVGMTQAAAGTAITSAGLTVGAVTQQYSASVPTGKVISQVPLAGESALPGAAVALVVSKGPQPVTVPDVVGVTQATAGTMITTAGLVVGAVTEQYSATVLSGRVISQNPLSGASVLPGTAVALVVSKGPQPVTVPNVVGMTQAAAGTAIANATLALGAVTEQYSATVAAGNVISQDPISGTSVLPHTAVALVVSKGPQPVAVPDVVGMTQAAAGTAITNAGLVVGSVTEQYSATVASGNVISQSPLAGESALPGAAVDLVVSKGPQPVSVPDVVGTPQATAEATIVGASLAVGVVTTQYSDTVASGNVISQSPLAGASELPGTPVDLVVSLGIRPVPDVVGLPQATAEAAITGANFTVGAVSTHYSSTVAAGNVISQFPLAGAFEVSGTPVDLVVSLGQAPVPNVVGMTQAAAEAAIVAADYTVGVVTKDYSATVPAGNVISQNPVADTPVPPGAPVDLVISLGPHPVTVPDVVGMAQAAAGSAITGAGLTVGSVSTEYSVTVPAGDVISQSPLAGDSVLPGTPVDLVVSLGHPLVPDVVGLSQAAAETAILAADFTVGAVTDQYSTTVPAGSVVSQSPLAGASATSGTPVDLVISLGPEPVTVPDVVGMAQAAAGSAITGAGLVVGVVTLQYSDTVAAGDVISQNPLAGETALTGSAVDLVVSNGPQPVLVPNVVGMTQADAEVAIIAAGLATGTATQAFSATVPVGDVVSQSPLAGTGVLPGSAVDLVVSKGPQMVTVPILVGLTINDAIVAILTAGLTTGAVTQVYSETVPAGYVISQSPLAGASVPLGSAVDGVLSLGPQPRVTVPDVVGTLQATAESTITGAGLTVGTVTTQYSPTIAAGNVISQSPLAGASVLSGAPVDLVVSLGPAPVPDVVGLPQATAEAAIVAADYTVGSVTLEYNLTVPTGNVISQSPLAGVIELPGTPVDLVVSLGPKPVVVPDVVGTPQAAAEAAIIGEGLTVGTVTQEYHATVPAGNVISQSPVGGTTALSGDPVALVVSLGHAPVPDVVGMTQAAAEAAIVAADYTVGTVTTAYSASVPVGDVISQNPVANTPVPPATPVALVVSLGPQPVPVPDVVGEPKDFAEATIVTAGLTVGTETGQYSDTVDVDTVISQNPVALTLVLPGSPVDLVVSLGPLTVPNLFNLPLADATTALTDLGYVVGVVTDAYSPTIPVGNVISQDPLAGWIEPVGTSVDLVLSKGPEPVPVPNVVGLPQAGAESLITGAGLVRGTVTTQYSDTIPSGSVISQAPLAGIIVMPGTPVDFVVSLGFVPVPDVVSLPQATAESTIVAAGYTVGNVSTQYSSTVPAGTVIGQNPLAGTPLPPGTPVDLTVSLGPQPIPVPDVVGMLQATAESTILSEGFTEGVVTEQYSATVVAGNVISQNPLAGALELPGTVVALVVSKGPEPVTVPDVVGLPEAGAEGVITAAGLTVGIVTDDYSITVPLGDVISQSPSAGNSVLPGVSVDLIVSKGPELVSVPDLTGLSSADAYSTLLAARLALGVVTQGYSDTVPVGFVISQSPFAGALVLVGTAVDGVLSLGPEPTVPDVVNMLQVDAENAITGAGLTVGTESEDYSDTVPAGQVISQDPLAGDRVPPDTPVNLVVSMGPEPVTVPDVVGMQQADAENAIIGAGLNVGTESSENNDTVPAGEVISQDPVGGDSVPPGSPVNIVVSLGSV